MTSRNARALAAPIMLPTGGRLKLPSALSQIDAVQKQSGRCWAE